MLFSSATLATESGLSGSTNCPSIESKRLTSARWLLRSMIAIGALVETRPGKLQQDKIISHTRLTPPEDLLNQSPSIKIRGPLQPSSLNASSLSKGASDEISIEEKRELNNCFLASCLPCSRQISKISFAICSSFSLARFVEQDGFFKLSPLQAFP